jgi:transcriptional regulator with XRE-family HTH domain
MKKKLANYLRPYRRRWGLTQHELAYLLGCKSGAVVSRLEGRKREPSLRIAVACFIVFGSPAAELFPHIATEVDEAVMARVWDLYDRLQGDPSRTTRTKLDILEDAIARAKDRARNTDL